MDLKANFPKSFVIMLQNDYTQKRSEKERNIIREQFHKCCNLISQDEIINLLLTCSYGVIVIDENNNLRGFSLSYLDTINDIFTTKIICGDLESVHMIMRCLNCHCRNSEPNEWKINLTYSNDEVVNLLITFGFIKSDCEITKIK